MESAEKRRETKRKVEVKKMKGEKTRRATKMTKKNRDGETDGTKVRQERSRGEGRRETQV